MAEYMNPEMWTLCPYLKETEIETVGTVKRITQQFVKCVGYKCPYFYQYGNYNKGFESRCKKIEKE